MTGLEKRYNAIVQEYIDKFSKKQGLELEHWVADRVGEIACFGCVFFFNFSDIVFDINTKQPKGQIIDWLYYLLDNEGQSLNYSSYCKGFRF